MAMYAVMVDEDVEFIKAVDAEDAARSIAGEYEENDEPYMVTVYKLENPVVVRVRVKREVSVL